MENFLKQVRRIVNLRWDETSAVDHPANEEEGFAVIKSKAFPIEETTMSDEAEFKAFADRVEKIMADIPPEQHSEFLGLLAALADRADGKVTKAVSRTVLQRVVDALDGMAQQEQWAGLLAKALQKGQELADEDTGEPAGVDEDYKAMVDVVQKAIDRAATGVPQRGFEAPPGSRERMVVDTIREVAAEEALVSTPDSLRKFKQGDVSQGDKRTDWAKALLKETLAYRDWLVSTAESAEEAKAIKARMQPLIDQYSVWAEGKYKDGRY